MSIKKSADEKKKVAPLDWEEGTAGAMDEVEEDKDAKKAKKSEMPALDDEHINHPRPEEGEKEQTGGTEKSEASEKNKEEEEAELEREAQAERDAESLKSLTPGDLAKSIKKLSEFAKDKSPAMRKSMLLEKAQKGEDLNKAEKAELFNLLGSKEVKTDLAKSVTKNLDENKKIQEALDVSDYLAEQHKELIKSLSALSSHTEKSSSRQYEFTTVLAKAVIDTGMLVKGLCEKIDSFASQPAREPKSLGVNTAKALNKSFAGVSHEAGATLSKSQVMDTMEQMIAESQQQGKAPVVNGEDLNNALITYECSNQMSPNMAQAVRGFIGKQ